MPYPNQSRKSARLTVLSGIANIADGVDYNHLAKDVNATLDRAKSASLLLPESCEQRRGSAHGVGQPCQPRIIRLIAIVVAVWLFPYRRLFCLT
jgi:hypothetical protein